MKIIPGVHPVLTLAGVGLFALQQVPTGVVPSLISDVGDIGVFLLGVSATVWAYKTLRWGMSRTNGSGGESHVQAALGRDQSTRELVASVELLLGKYLEDTGKEFQRTLERHEVEDQRRHDEVMQLVAKRQRARKGVR